MPLNGRTAYLLYRLKASFWFVPGLMACVAIAAAAACLWADGAGASAALRPLGVPFNIGAESARQLLSTLAGAMVTVVSLVFSLTLVALTVAAGNLGARLLERYMQNRVVQASMGLFVGSFGFTVMVLAATGDGSDDVPALSVVMALVLSIVGVLWLMFAFHDLARTLQIDQAAAEIAGSLRQRIAGLAEVREEAPARSEEFPAGAPVDVVTASGCGYVEAVDLAALATAAEEQGLTIDVVVAQGDYVTPADAVAAVYGTAAPEPARRDRIAAAVALGGLRTEADDLMFLVHLLVEIACRALSPGVNDLYTALACLDHLTGALVQAVSGGLQSATMRDGDGRLLVRTRSADAERMIDSVLDTLRRDGVHNTTFALRLISSTRRVLAVADGHPVAPRIGEHLQRIAEHAAAAVAPVDRPAVVAAVEADLDPFTVNGTEA